MSVYMHALEVDALLNGGNGDMPDAANLLPEAICQPSKDGDGSPTDADSPSIASRATRGLVQRRNWRELSRFLRYTVHALPTRSFQPLNTPTAHVGGRGDETGLWGR